MTVVTVTVLSCVPGLLSREVDILLLSILLLSLLANLTVAVYLARRRFRWVRQLPWKRGICGLGRGRNKVAWDSEVLV